MAIVDSTIQSAPPIWTLLSVAVVEKVSPEMVTKVPPKVDPELGEILVTFPSVLIVTLEVSRVPTAALLTIKL